MADSKITELTEKTEILSDDDLLVIVDSESAPLTTKKIKKSTAFSGTVINVRKSTPGSIPPGKAVYLVGYDATNNVPLVELADNSSDSTMPSYGVVKTTVTDSANGLLLEEGRLDDQNTAAFPVGAELYISTNGDLTDSRPTGTALVQKIGTCIRSDIAAGIIEVFGAGRANDLPNLPTNNVWVGDGSSVPQATDLDVEISANSDVSANTTHRGRTDNPHSVTATQVGLGNVDNTSDVDKPVSTAQAAADTAVQNFSIDRSNHTGTQLSSTISDFASTVRSTILTGLSIATSTAVTAADTILQAIGKLQGQLNKLPEGEIAQYSNSSLQTTATNLVLTIDTARENNLGSLFTKPNGTQIQCNFNGRVSVSYYVNGYTSADDRGGEIQIRKNTVNQTWTLQQFTSKKDITRKNSVSGTFDFDCSNGDTFSLLAVSPEGATVTLVTDSIRFSVRAIRID